MGIWLFFLVLGRAQAPTFLTQPMSRVGLGGDSFGFSATVAGEAPLSYQWYVGERGDTSTPVAGATNPGVEFPAVSTTKRFWLRVTNAAGSSDSRTVTALTWNSRGLVVGPRTTYGVAYANGQYILTGNEFGATSTDGNTWVSATTADVGGAATFGNGVYVVGGGSIGGQISSSTDGYHWTSRASSQSKPVGKVIFNGSRFIAAGGGISTSEDGLAWTNRLTLSGVDEPFGDLAFGGGLHVAVSLFRMVTSPDGLTWTTRALPTNQSLRAIAYGGGRFVLLAGAQRNEVWTSVDGLTWAKGAMPTLSSGEDIPSAGRWEIAFGDGVFVATIGRALLISDDGANWTFAADFLPEVVLSGNHVGSGNGRFIIGAYTGEVFQSGPMPNAISIIASPESGYVKKGGTTTLSISATGPTLSYQWYQGVRGDASNPIVGATSSTLAMAGLTVNTSYWVRITSGSQVSDSATAIVTLAELPSYSTQVPNYDIYLGASATLAVTVTGVPAPTLQWYEGESGDVSHPITNATAAQFSTPAISAVKRYWVRASNFAGTRDSATSVVTPWRALNSSVPSGQISYLGGRYYTTRDGAIISSEDGVSWATNYWGTMARSYGVSSGIYAVAQGNGIFLGIGPSGSVTSSDGNNWIEIGSLPARSDFSNYSIAFGAGLFVVTLADDTVVYTSVDGQTWTTRRVYQKLNNVNKLSAVVYGNGRFVAVGYEVYEDAVLHRLTARPLIFSSSDGISWAKAAGISDAGGVNNDSLSAVSFNEGKFLAVGSSMTVFTSTNGSSWVSAASGLPAVNDRDPAYSFTSAAIGGGHYVIGTPSQDFFFSSDGMTWSRRTGPLDFQGRSAIYGGGKFLMTGPSGSVFSSVDGLNWDLAHGVPSASTNTLGMAGGNGRHVLMTQGTVAYATSDGIDWLTSAAIDQQATSRTVFGAGVFLTGGAGGAIFKSINGVDWSSTQVAPGGDGIGALASDLQGFIAISRAGRVYRSTDGSSWQFVSGSAPLSGVGLASSGDLCVMAVGTKLYVSRDLVTWTEGILPTNGYSINAVAHGNGVFVAIRGSDGGYLYSPDGLNWSFPVTERLAGQVFADLIFTRGRFLAVSSLGYSTSTDGRIWTSSGFQSRLPDAPSVTIPSGAVSEADGHFLVSSNQPWRMSAMPDSFVGVIARQPLGEIVTNGRTASLTVGTSGSGLTFQWFAGASGDTSRPVSGATAATFVTPVLTTDTSYWVRVSQGASVFNSTTAQLHVLTPPTIVAPPRGVAATLGAAVNFSVSATSATPLSFQWLLDGAPLPGATASSLTIGDLQTSNAGGYSVRISSLGGTVTSAAASLVVLPAGNSATHAVASPGFVGGSTVTISNRLNFTTAVTGLTWQVLLPDGWSFVSDTGASFTVKPAAAASHLLEWTWASLPSTPLDFAYTLSVPSTHSGAAEIVGVALLTSAGVAGQMLAKPDPLPVLSLYHSADSNRDGFISLVELTRVIEIYNVRRGTTRTGAYKIAPTTEDGFALDPERVPETPSTLSRWHSLDADHDGCLSLFELTRAIQLYNTRSGNIRTGAYRLQAGTEDGYAPGP